VLAEFIGRRALNRGGEGEDTGEEIARFRFVHANDFADEDDGVEGGTRVECVLG
jgi:hypothetical protein